MHVITGVGRSGTSFIAELFHNSGIEDMGSYMPEIDAGYEHPDIVRINKRMISDFWGSDSDKEELIQVADSLKICKDPRFMATLPRWVVAGANIESVILCLRDYDEIIDNSNKTKAGWLAFFEGWDELSMKDLCRIMNDAIEVFCDKEHIKMNCINFKDINYPKYIYDRVSHVFSQYKVSKKNFMNNIYPKTIRKPA